MTAKSLKCPICRKDVEAPAGNQWFPFCSNRCKVIDLSKWLNGEYRVPVVEPDETDLEQLEEAMSKEPKLH